MSFCLSGGRLILGKEFKRGRFGIKGKLKRGRKFLGVGFGGEQ